MGLIGRKIIQTVTWIDPTAPPPPSLNYEENFPITVFDAVRRDIDDETSETLTEVLDEIMRELDTKQLKVPALGANYLMTYAGVSGSVGSIQMSREIPWDPDKQTHDKIPTEKAVGDLMQKLGLVNPDGTIIDPNNRKVRWSDIVGRPLIYETLGINADGFMTQKAVKEAIDAVRETIRVHEENSTDLVKAAIERLDDHRSNMNNPHGVSLGQIGGVSQEAFDYHTQIEINPHGITAEMLNLGNVENTKDIDKPISRATQEALDKINQQLKEMNNGVEDLNYVTGVEYNQSTGILAISYRDGSQTKENIPINGLVDEIRYDSDTKELVIFELGGTEKRVSLMDLYIRYKGYVGDNITVEIVDESVASDELVPMLKPDVNYTWETGEAPNGEYFDGTPHNMSEITKPETEILWDPGTLPFEDGDIEDIDLEEMTGQELFDLWMSGKLPIEDSDVHDNVESGIKIIKAHINAMSITDLELANDAVITRVIMNGAVTTEKIANKAITSDKLADEIISNDKISKYTITNSKFSNRSVDGRVLFSSHIDGAVLAVLRHGEDPIWSKITSSMISAKAITSDLINNSAIANIHIQDNAIRTSNIEDLSVTTEKIANNAVDNTKLAGNSVSSNKIEENVMLRGTPSVGKSPADNSSSNEIATTSWIRRLIKDTVFETSNIGDRSIDGSKLFSSPVRHRVLVTLRANSDPEWGTIDHEMIENNIIETDNIVDKAVTGNKIADSTISRKHLVHNLIGQFNIEESAVVSEKIFKSENANMVLAAVSENSHPVYSKINRKMLENNIISSMQIEDHSITPSKLQSDGNGYKVLGIGLKNTNPTWTEVVTKMIADRAITGDKMFSSPIANRVLAVLASGENPVYTKIISEMIEDKSVKRQHIADASIYQEHLQDKIIEGRHIMDWSIQSNNIAHRAITGVELFTSPIPNRVLAITTEPYSNPDWLQIVTDMIEDEAITSAKLFTSNYDYRVLGTTRAGAPPEYIRITKDFIVDDTITPVKLVKDFVLKGTPSLMVPPADDANNRQLASTDWVRKVIKASMESPDFINVTTDMIMNHSVTGQKLFKSTYDGPRVLGVTAPDKDVEYILIEEDLIANGSVTSNKVERDIRLLGSPSIEIRPLTIASDKNGDGNLIPDCQWVLDRIAEYSGEGGSSTPSIPATIDDASISTSKLIDRSVTAPKLFTSAIANRVLAVLDSNSDPQYTDIINEMISNRAINGRTLFTSGVAHRIIGIKDANTDPSYITIDHEMLENNVIDSNNIRRDAITTEKIANESITREKFSDQPIVDSVLLQDNSVINDKIADSAVSTSKLLDKAVTSEKIADNVILKTPTVEPVPVNTKSLRNITVSDRLPTDEDGDEGDIWITVM